MTSGALITGASVDYGTYQILNNQLSLKRKTESWFPVSNKSSDDPGFKDKVAPEEHHYPIKIKNQNEFATPGSTGVWTTFHKKP